MFKNKNPVPETATFNAQPLLEVVQSSIDKEIDLQRESLIHDYLSTHRRRVFDLDAKINDTLESERKPLVEERQRLEENLWKEFPQYLQERLRDFLGEVRNNLSAQVKE